MTLIPWHISTSAPGCSGFAVVKDSDGKVVGCHPTKKKALAQLAALNINVKGGRMTETVAPTTAPELSSHLTAASPAGHGMDSGDLSEKTATDLTSVHVIDHKENPQNHGHEDLYPVTGMASAFPTEDLFRAVQFGDYELRESSAGPPVMFGHFTPVGEWAEIDSVFEGRFMERSVEGFADESFQRSMPKVLFQHGRDPSMGDQVMGIPTVLRSDAYNEVPLFDGIPPLVMSGLRNKAYGMSYRFSVQQEDVVRKPAISEHNPGGLPERTIVKASVSEFGPVTFPAYVGATAGIRSLTDKFRPRDFDFEVQQMALEHPKHLAAVIERALKGDKDEPVEAKPQAVLPRFRTREEYLQWLSKN